MTSFVSNINYVLFPYHFLEWSFSLANYTSYAYFISIKTLYSLIFHKFLKRTFTKDSIYIY